ncbi:MAG: 5-formyltetrahydrofolate cyclo-ligase, partial [Betaproteobacteria bacterium]
MDPEALKTWRMALRRELIARRVAASADEHARWSAAVDDRVERLLQQLSGRVIAFCWPYQAEYDARAVVLGFLARGATAALPVVVAPRTPLIFRKWDSTTPMTAGVYDIPIPVDSEEVTPDVALIAVCGFDEQGYRLGYGAGFFDRTLASMPVRPVVVGVGFELSRIPTIHPQRHDIPLDFVVTEAGAFRRESGGLAMVERPASGVAPRSPTKKA